jgi:uncharacterized protein YbjT (DUF2867 family)
MAIKTVCVLGGGGFVGHHLVTLLASRGFRVRVPARRREDAKDLLVLPGVEVVEADIHDPAALRSLLGGMEAAVNLVGILHETTPGDAESDKTRRGSFRQAHVELPRKVIAACREAGVGRLLHMSALGADARSPSAYQRSKAEGESLALQAADDRLAVTVFRPSVIFGPGDSFLTLFADLLRFAPAIPLAGAAARFQPIYVADVARAFADALDKPETFGQAYNLCGPRVYTLEELVRLTAKTLGMCRFVLPLGQGASLLFARLMELKPGAKIMTRDNHYAMLTDNVCAEGYPALFGKPTPLEGVIGYLRSAHPRGHYHGFRRGAGR